MRRLWDLIPTRQWRGWRRRRGSSTGDWKRSVVDCFELNNFTVIDLHVVHLINVVDDLAKERKEKKETFCNFLPIARWTSPLKRYRNGTAVRHFLLLWCVTKEGFKKKKRKKKWNQGGLEFFFLIFFLSRLFSQKAKGKKHVKHDSLLCSYLVLRFSVRLSSSLKTSIRVI